MKRILLVLFSLVSLESFGIVENYIIRVGESVEIAKVCPLTTSEAVITGDAAIIDLNRPSSTMITVTGVKAGYSTFWGTNNHLYVFHVIDVCNIEITNQVNMVVGESYTYSPIITDSEATTSLSWASSNSGVATINSGGMITAVAPGKTTITCTATNGVKTQSLVTVTPLLLSGITISNQSYEINVDDEVQLSAICSPENATSKAVKWMSANENIAQVDNEGNVKAIAPGYCSVYCIADDGSGKYDKCLVHVLGEGAVKGDINGDGGVTPQDASMILQFIAKKITW